MGRKIKNLENIVSEILSPNKDQESILTNLLKTVPHLGDNCYLKVYKTRPLPVDVRQPQFKTEINDLTGINDLEIYIRNLAIENSWGSGEYAVFIFQRTNNQPIVRDQIKFEIECPSNKETNLHASLPPPPPPPPPTSDLCSQIKDSADLIKTFQGLAYNNSSDVVRSQVEAFKSGLEAVKNSSSGNNLVDTVMALKELGIVGHNGHKQNDDLFLLIKLLKETGLLNQPPQPTVQTDLFTEIKKMAEIGLIRFNTTEEKPKEDPISQVSKVMELVNTLTPLLGGGVERPSPVIELIRTLGPSVPKMVENVTETVNKVAEVQKMKLSAKFGLGLTNLKNDVLRNKLPDKLPESTNNIVSSSFSPHMTASVPSPNQQAIEKNPIIHKILEAIEKNDTGFYPTLKDLLFIYVGDHILDSLLDRSVLVENFLSILASQTKESQLNSPKAISYLNGFISWYEQEIYLTVKCDKCGEEMEILKEDWKLDNICDCGGKLVDDLKAEKGGK